MIPYFQKSFLPLTYFFIFSQIAILVKTIAKEQTQPNVILSAVFWEKYQRGSFSYAPWGNEKDDNASIVDISVGSSALSKKFVYYGDETLNFYEKKSLDDWEVDLEEGDQKQLSGNLIAQFSLPPTDNEGIKEYILLFVNKKNNGLWKIYPIPFSKDEVPLENYKFISQSNKLLYFIFGNEKFALEPGKSRVCPVVLEDGERRVPLKVLSRKNSSYAEHYNQKWSHSSNIRGICFVGFSGDKLSLKRTSERSQPLSTALGFNVSPKIVRQSKSLENESEDFNE